MPDCTALGREAEDRAAQFLLNEGYTLVTRRFKTRGGEVDIIALDGDVLVFVEVKYRERGAPEEQVGFTKVKRFNLAVDDYLQRFGATNALVRFDLIAVTPTQIRHHKGAFSSG